MSHRRDCPTKWEAERRGERDQGYGTPSYSNPYSRQPFERDYCREAERSWEDGHRMAQHREEERQQEERRTQQAADRRRQQEEYWSHEERERLELQRQEDEYFEQMQEIEDFWSEQAYLMDEVCAP